MARVAGYVRVSSIDQVDGYSLDAQQHAIRAYCRANDLGEPDWFEDAGKSAKHDSPAKRPAFARLLAAVERREYDTVIVHKLDRWARNAVVSLSTIATLDKHGCAFVSISERMDFTGPWGKAFLGILSIFAQLFSDNLGTETRKGIAEKQRQGGHHGLPPFGSERVDGKLRLVPAYAETLRLLYGLMAAHSDYEVACEMNRRGIPTRLNATAWSDTAIYYMRTDTGAWLLEQGPEWAALYDAARRRTPLPRVRRASTVYRLTGLMRCTCGGWIRFNSEKSGTRYGTCVKHGRDGWSCPHWRGLNVGKVEVFARAWLLALPPPQYSEAIRRLGGEEDRARLDERRENIRRARIDGLYRDEAVYQRDLAQLRADEARLPVSASRLAEVGRGLALAQRKWDTWREPAQNLYLRGLIDHFLCGDGAIVPVLRPEYAGLWEGQVYAERS